MSTRRVRQRCVHELISSIGSEFVPIYLKFQELYEADALNDQKTKSNKKKKAMQAKGNKQPTANRGERESGIIVAQTLVSAQFNDHNWENKQTNVFSPLTFCSLCCSRAVVSPFSLVNRTILFVVSSMSLIAIVAFRIV